MKKAFIVLIAFAALAFCACNSCKKGNDVSDTIKVGDSIKIVEAVDSTLWGRMGEGTAMNVVEFISDKGDTLYLRKQSDEGEPAHMVGSISNFTDRFAITVASIGDEESAYLLTCINTSQLLGVWKNKDTKLSLFADGAADNEAAKYTQWRLINGKLVLSGSTTTEYGETARTDTMIITLLNEDSLKYTTPQHEEVKLGR